MPFFSHDFGDFTLTALHVIPDGFANPFNMFPNIDRAEIESKFVDSPQFFGGNSEEMKFTINTFLIQINGKKILVDTGIPVDSPDSVLLESLKEAGIGLDEIDLVILTHRDGDHVGGSCRDGVALYPNATYLIATTEYQGFKSDPARSELFTNSVAILEAAGKLKVVGEDAEVFPSVTLWPTPGHRGGATSVLVGDQLAIMADTWHTPVQVGNPGWSIKFDEDATLAAATRKLSMDRLSKEHRTVAVPHTIGFGLGKIKESGSGQTWEPLVSPES